MATELLMPKLGLTMTEGTIDEWKVKEGDEVHKGDIIYSVATDKLTNDVDVPCKEIVGWLGAAGEAVPAGKSASPAAAAPAAAQTATAPKSETGSVLVIGGGPGGYVAAIRAAQLGAKVTLIEKDKVGGTCLNRGCMPTKAMLHTSEIYEAATGSAAIGIVGKEVEVDWEKVQAFRASVVEKLTSGVKALCKANKVKLVAGEAVFTGPKTVAVGSDSYSADKIILAAGSYPIIPGIPGVKESKAVIDSTACLELDHIPESLLVIGGGVIGLELGSVYRRYGARVTVVEMMPRLLPLMDGELTNLLQAKLQGEGMDILTSSQVASVTDTDKGAKVTVKTPEGEKVLEVEKILLCVGRGPATAGLGLEKAGIAVEKGFVQTNDHGQADAGPRGHGNGRDRGGERHGR